MIVFAIFAETTTPTFVFRRRRRQVNCSFSPAAAGAGAARLRATVRFPTGRAATAAFAGAFGVDAARVEAAFAGAFARVVVFAVVSFGDRGAEPPDRFSAIGLTLSRSLAHHSEKAGDLVRIQESRPFSATKRWRLVEVISRAGEAGAAAPRVADIEKALEEQEGVTDILTPEREEPSGGFAPRPPEPSGGSAPRPPEERTEE